MLEERLHNRLGTDRITSRQVDELVGIARGLIADSAVCQAEVEFLQKWLAANLEISDQPLIRSLYDRVNGVLADGIADEDECRDLLETLDSFVSRDFELGEVLKSSSLPLCDPAPVLNFLGHRYSFTGTFTYGQRRDCEAAVQQRGGLCGSLTKHTDVLVIGTYATESWKHSAFGTKIIKAVDYRNAGVPIAIVGEEHWASQL